MPTPTRRDFVRGAATAATAVSYSRVLGANDRVRMGFIGLGNRGSQVHDAFLECPGAQTVAICDLRPDYLDFAATRARTNPKQYREYSALLDNKDVDAVVIATPDHWHALMFIDACNAGKDVYVEKPLSLTVAEGRRMVETAKRTNRVVQVGTQRRSSEVVRQAVDFVRGGGLGQVTVARGYLPNNEWPNGIGNPPDEAPPDAWTWDHWLGPAPWVAYNRNRMFYNFRWFYEYSGGQLTNFGTHFVDALRWCIDKDAPRKVAAFGGRYAVKDNREIPDTLEVMWEFDGPTLMTFSQINANGAPGNARGTEMELRGTKGTMYLSDHGWEVVPEAVADQARPALTPLDRKRSAAYEKTRKTVIEPRSAKGVVYADAAHAQNFVECVRSRGKCNADILTGHLSTAATLIGNIALKTEAALKWDAAAERFTNSEDANRLLDYEYRAPYKLG